MRGTCDVCEAKDVELVRADCGGTETFACYEGCQHHPKPDLSEISQPYAQELARQVDELEADNAALLTALQSLLQYLDDHDWGTIPEGTTADRARAAIAKATGAQS